MSERPRSRAWLGLAGLGLVTVGAGAAALYWYLRPRPISLIESAEVVPATAIATTAIATDSQTWETLAAFVPPEARDRLQQQWQAGGLSELAAVGLDYQQDVEPAIGEAVVAYIPVAGEGAQTLVVVGITNRLKALQLVATFKEQTSGDSSRTEQLETYRGVPIFATTSADGDLTYGSMAGRFLLFSSSQAVLRQAIDTKQGKAPSYADRPEARTMLDTELDLPNQFARLYIVDLPALIEDAAQSVPTVGSVSGPLGELAGIESIAVSAGATDSGLRARAVTRFSQPRPQSIRLSGEAFDLYPENTVALIYGRALDRSWQQIEDSASDDPDLEAGLEVLTNLLRTWQLDIQADLLGWMDGEYAVGAVATAANPSGLGLALMLETSQPATGQATLAKLDRFVRFLPGLQLETGEYTLDGAEVTRWRDRQGDAVISHGWLNPNRLLVTVGLPFSDVAAAPQSLRSSDVHRELASELPATGDGYLYLDATALAQLSDRASPSWPSLPFPQLEPPEPEDLNPQATLDTWRGLSLSAQQQDPTTLTVDVAITLERY